MVNSVKSFRNSKNIPKPLLSDPENKLKGLVFDEDLGITYNTVDKVITLSTKLGGKDQSILLDQKNKEIKIQHTDNHSIHITDKGIDIKTSGDFNITANGNINLLAGKNVELNGKEINLTN